MRSIGEFAAAPYEYLQPALVASRQRVVLESESFERSGLGGMHIPQRSVFSGGPAGPLELLSRCGLSWSELDADVFDDVVAAIAADCHGAAIRDFSEPEGSAFEIAGRPGGLRVAGRYVAAVDDDANWADGRPVSLVVYDRMSGKEVYRLGPGAIGRRVLGAFDVDVQGRVAFGFGTGRGLSARVWLGWASPRQPVVHTLRLRPADQYLPPRLEGGRIAFVRSFYGKDDLSPLLPGQIGLANLHGGARIVASGVDVTTADGGFDFDGSRIAWRQRGCIGGWIRIVRVDEQARPVRQRCPLQLAGTPTVRAGVITIRLSCRGLPEVQGTTSDTCGADHIRVRLHADGRDELAARTRGNPFKRFYRLRLSRPARRVFDRAERVRLDITARVVDFDGNTYERSCRVRLRT